MNPMIHRPEPEIVFAKSIGPMAALTCRTHALVFDVAYGPADRVMSIAQRVYNGQPNGLCLLSVEEPGDAQVALLHGMFDLVVVGISSHQSRMAFALLDNVYALRSNLPVIVITEALTPAESAHLNRYAAVEVVALPNRATELRAFLFCTLAHYLHAL